MAKVSKYGQWKYPGEDTIVPTPDGGITMQGVPYPVLGIDNQGNQQMMMPGGEYQFPGNSVYEIPMMKYGGDISIPSLKRVRIKSLPKAQDGVNFNFDYNFDKSFAENMELNRRAQAMGWNSVKEYEASGWGKKGYVRVPDVIRQQRIDKGIPADQIPEYEKVEEKKPVKNSSELQGILDKGQEATKKSEWEQLGYENKFYSYKNDPDFFDSHARFSDNPEYNDWIRKTVYSGKWEYNPVTGESRRVGAGQEAEVSPETKTLAKDVRTWTKEEKLAHPNSTIKNLPKTEVEQLRKEDASFDQYVTNLEKEAGKSTAAAQSKAMVNNPAFYAPGVIAGLAVAPELLGAELFGTGVTASNILNPMFIGHGIKNTLDSDSDMRKSWSKAYDNPTGANLFDATLETGLNSLNFLGARALPGDIKAFGKGYQNIATGNSIIPYAWKSPAVGLSQEASADMFKGLLNSGKLTPQENALIIEYQSNSRPFTGRSTAGTNILNPEKREALNNIIKKYNLDVNSDAILTRRFNSSRGTLGAEMENGRINFGDRPTSFSAGVGTEGYSGAPDRLVIPNRYVKNMGNNLLANPYGKVSDETLGFLEGSAKDFALNAPSLNEAIIGERELIGTGLDFKQIGKVKNDIGGFDYIVKPKNIKAKTTKVLPGSPNSRQYQIRGLAGPSTKTGLTEENVAAAIEREKQWIQSDEYLTRRAANTGETVEQIKADVAKILSTAEDARFNLNANITPQGQMTSKSLFQKTPTVEIAKHANNPINTLEHETAHLYSPSVHNQTDAALHKGILEADVASLPASERGVYANYPTLGKGFDKTTASIDLGAKENYLNLGYEQQVRHLNARADILKANNLPLEAELTEAEVKPFVDTWAEKINKISKDPQNPDLIKNEMDYDEIWLEEALKIRENLLKEYGVAADSELNTAQALEYKRRTKEELTKVITNVLNKAWVALPAGIGVGAAMEQKKRGGAVNAISKYKSTFNNKVNNNLPKAQTEGQFSNPDFKPSWDWTQTAAENAELNRRAQAAGHNSVDEYRASGWAWQPKQAQDERGQGKYFKKAEPQTKSWGEKMMEIPKTPQSETSAFPNMNLKKMNQDLISGSAVAESTMPANMFKAPLEWEGLTGAQIIDQMKAQAAYDALPEAAKRQDVLTADTRSDTEKFARQAWTAISHPMETISAVSRGYDIPSGYMGMGNPYEGYGVESPMTSVLDMVAGAPGFIANAAYRQGEKIVDNPGEYLLTNTLGLFDPDYRGEALGNYLDLSAAVPASRAAATPLVRSAENAYNKVATGNSRLTDLGLQAWKVERPNLPVKSSDYIPKTYTDDQAALLDKFGKGMNLTPEEWAQMEDFTRSGATDFSKADYPISRILGYYERGSAENKLLEGLKVGDVFHTPTEKTIRTWSVGTPGEGDLTNFGNTRLVIPSRYTKDLGSNFAGMPYRDKRIPFIWNPKRGFNSGAIPEKEIMGNIPKGFKVIGSSQENGLNNLIIKPLKKQGGSKKKQMGFQILTDANGKYVFVKT